VKVNRLFNRVPDMRKLQNPIQMAVIGAPHGVQGAVRVKTYTGEATALGDYGPLYDAAGRAFEITDIRPQKEVVVVRFKGVQGREAAEALNGTALFVERSQLPETEEDEFYHADLVGLQATDRDGTAIGTVRAVLNFGGGDILEIALPTGQTAIVPFSRAAVPEVDVSARRITLDPVAAGLAGDEPEPAGGGR
jgi:16S rRNA processing protein RimM